MKILSLLALFSLTAYSHSNHNQIPDIPPDAPSSEYRAILHSQSLLFANDGLDAVIRAGERNLSWLERINSRRPPEKKLSFTSKETQKGYPIDEPSEYSPAIILKDFADLQAAYPRALAQVVFGSEAFPDHPPVAEEDYIRWSRLLDREYQSAARWRTMSGWLPILESRRAKDIRGYYFLSRLEGREQKLQNFTGLAPEEQARIREWLIGVCLNNYDSLSVCQQRIDRMIQAKEDLNAYYSAREPRSAETYRANFTIPNYARRKDFRWDTAANRLVAPFTDPVKEDVRHFMKFNVEDEWRWGDWRLELPFTTERGHPYVVFRPGVTPNVNGLGGDRITMNSQQPLTEYDAQWTIRHEFGHVLGLPDCYVEFYAAERQAIVNYQLDVDNIMCSRRGRVKQENMDELKRVYGN